MNTILRLMPLLTVAACAPREPAHDVLWYVAHRDMTEAKVKWCVDSADRRESIDCQNALEAEARLSMGSQKDAPALNWNAASAAH